MGRNRPGMEVPRLGRRCPVRESAELRVVRSSRFGRPKELTLPVVLQEVSVNGAKVRLEGVEPRPDEPVKLGIGGQWSMARIRWRADLAGDVWACGLEFIDARPSFLSQIHAWLGRDDTDAHLYD